MGYMQISESEAEVMQLLWTAGQPLTSSEIIEGLQPVKRWKPSTVWTFLGRLTEKGMVTVDNTEKKRRYSAALTEQQYKQAQTSHFLKMVHGGSVKSFFAALSQGVQLSSDEFQELKDWLESEKDAQ